LPDEGRSTLETMMKPTSPRTDTDTNPSRPPRDDTTDRSSADTSGGAPAAEEDIGTEGAGTEPRTSTDLEQQTDRSSSKPRDEQRKA
jgi:hypothetical protein